MDYLCEDDLDVPAASSSRCTKTSVGSKQTSRRRANAKKEVADPAHEDQFGQGAICVTDSVSRLGSNAAQNHGCTSDSAKSPKGELKNASTNLVLALSPSSSLVN